MSADGLDGLHADLSELEEVVEAAARDFRDWLRDVVDGQPIVALGAAAGIGFVLGGGLPRGSITLLLEVGTRMAAAWLQRGFTERADAQETER